MKKIIYVDTLYSLFLMLIIEENIDENIYCFDDAYLEKFRNKFKNVYIMESFKKTKTKLERYLKIRKFLKNLIMRLDNKNKYIIYFKDSAEYGQFFMNNYQGEFYLIEDGVINYSYKQLDKEQNKKINFGKILKRKFVYLSQKNFLSFGLSNKIKKIYLTGILPIPNIIKNKVEIVNIEEKWKSLSYIKRKKILDIFNINIFQLEKIINEENKILLITQPLSEDGTITENEKLEIYKEILEKKKGKRIYIKPHPREQTDYIIQLKEYRIKVIEKDFPIEILMLLNMNFVEVVTVFSTAALNMKSKYKVEFIGTKKYPKLYEKFGEITSSFFDTNT